LTVNAGNYTKVLRNEVRKPFININNNIPLEVDKNTKSEFSIITSNPQGKIIDADKLVLEIENPKSEKKTYTLTKTSSGTFTLSFKYDMSGIYYFRMEATEPEYETITIVTQTNVLNKTNFNLYPMILLGATVLLAVLMIVKRLRK
jgi:hypothetical protein